MEFFNKAHYWLGMRFHRSFNPVEVILLHGDLFDIRN